MSRITTKSTIACMVAGILCAGASEAVAQIGPDLRPPGLDDNHPLSSYTKTGKGAYGDDWRHEAAWDLNASDVVFSASKKRQLISEAPATIHVITDREIATHGWRSLPDILRHVPGIQTITIDSQYKSVMIRGLVGTDDHNSRILWLQNGVPMNDYRDAGIWLDETYPVEMIKRIEVVLGPGSALYGAGAFQGVVNIFTKDPKDIQKNGEYSVSMGSNLTFKASAIAAYNNPDKDFGILAHVTASTTQGPGLVGDAVYSNRYLMETAANSVGNAKDADSVRFNRLDANSDKHWYDINLKLNYKQFKLQAGFMDVYSGWDGSELEPSLGYSITDVKEHDPGVFNKVIEADNYRFNRREFYSDIIYEDSIGDSWTILGVLSYRLNQYNHKNYMGMSDDLSDNIFIDPGGKMGYISAFSLPVHYDDKINFDEYQHKLYLLAQAQWRIIDTNELIFGAGFEYDHLSSPDLLYKDSPSLSEKGLPGDVVETPDVKLRGIDGKMVPVVGDVNPYLFVQDEQRFWNDRIILTLGGRLDFYDVNNASNRSKYSTFNYWTDSLGWAVRFAFLGKWTDWFTSRISVGTAFKRPSVFQRYADTFDFAPAVLTDSDHLTNEQLRNIELSLVFTPTYYLSLRIDGFVSKMLDLISFEYDSGNSIGSTYNAILGRYRAKQSWDANVYGFELGVTAKVNTSWSLYGNYDFLYSERIVKETGVSEPIVDDAMHRLRVGFSYTDENVTADLAGFFVSSPAATKSVFADEKYRLDQKDKYSTPAYFLLQPSLTIGLPANLGLMMQGSLAFSEGMADSPTHNFYYETEAVPVNRYSFMMSLTYPFRNTSE